MKKRKAAFFDRDGTLIRDVSYLARLEDIELMPQAVTLARTLQQQGCLIVIVTNQSGIARGFFDEDFVRATHQQLASMLAEHTVFVDGFYFCPHHPTVAQHDLYRQDCMCRKPKPGMLLQAAQDFDIDLAQSLMFGDKELDLVAGQAAGCRSFDINTLFGRGSEQYATLVKENLL